MPTYTVQFPNGEKYDVEAPEGTSDAQAYEYALSYLSSTPEPTPVEPVVPELEPEEETSLLGYGLETGKALLGGAAGLVESAATGASFILPEEAEQAARARIAEIGSGVQEALAPGEAYEDSKYLDFVSGVGSTLPFLAAAPFGAVGIGAGVLTGITAGSGEAAQRAIAAGATEDEISKAAALGTIPGAMEMFGPARIVNRFRKVLGKNADEVAEELSGNIIRKISQATERAPLGRVGKAAIDEGIQEAISEVGQNLIQRGIYDPERGVFTDTGESFGMGAGVGGLLQGIAEAIIPGQQRRATRRAEAAAEEEQAAITKAEAEAAETAMAQVPVGETRDFLTEERAAAEQTFQGPEPEQLMDVEDLAGVTAEDPIEVEIREQAETTVRDRYSDAPLSPDAFDAAVEAEADIIRNRATAASTPPTPETDLIADLEETQQVEALLDEDAYAAIEAEEEAAKAKVAKAKADKLEAAEVARFEAELREVQQRLDRSREETTQAKRGPILAKVLAETDTTSQVNTEKTFSKALADAGISNTTPTDAEKQIITEKTYVVADSRPGIDPDGGGIESLIPEARTTKVDKKPVRSEPRETVKTPVTSEFFDSLGLPKSAPIRKRKALQGKDVNSPEVQGALQTLISSYSGIIKKAEDRGSNPQAARKVRANLLNYRALGRVVPPSTYQDTFKPNTVPVETRTSSTAVPPSNISNLPQPPVSAAVLPDTDETKLARRKNKALPNRDKYTPAASVSYYMQETTDTDQALRTIAFEGAYPFTLAQVSPGDVAQKELRRAKAATQWVQKNLSPEANEKLTEYQTFYERQELSAEAWLEQNERRLENERLKEKLDRNYVESEKRQDDKLTEEVLEEVVATQDGLESATLEDLDGVVDYLRSNAVAASMPLVSEAVNDKVLDGDVKGALEQLAIDTSNSEIKRTARILANAIKDTSIEFVDGLTNPRGEQFAGNYTAAQNRIEINLAQPLNSHTLLHEAAHAVTSKTLDNPAHPVTKQLTKLFNEVKDKLPTDSYGRQTLKDFVAEAYTNPSFRAKLAGLETTSKLTAWQRFTNAIRTLLGMPTVSVRGKDQEAVDYINTLIAESLDTRNATTVPQDLANNNEARAVHQMLAGGTKLAKIKTLQDAKDYIWGRAEQFNDTSRMTLINGMTLDNLVDLVKANPDLETFYEAARGLQEVIKKQDGTRNELTKAFSNKLKDFRAAFSRDSKAVDIFNELVGRSTIEEVDPTKPKSRYEQFGYSYTGKDGEFVENVTFKTEADRDAAVKALDRTNVLAGVKKLNSTPERVTEYDRVRELYNSLSPQQQAAYRDMRDMYKNMNQKILKSIDNKLDGLGLEEVVKETVRERAFRKILSAGTIEPYFKLDREGDYWVEFDYKTPEGTTEYGVSAHTTPGERKIAIRRLEENPNVVTGSIKEKPRPDMSAEGFNVPTAFLVKLLDSLKEPVTITETDTAGNETQREVQIPQQAIDLVNDVLLKSLPEQGLVQGHQQRKGYAGYETNALKTFETAFPKLINSFTNLSYEVDLTNAANKIKDEASLPANANSRDRAWVRDISLALVGTKDETNRQVGKLPSYLEFVKNPNLPNWARKLRQSSFIYTLGFNVSSAAVNMSTLPMIVGPLLSGKFGGGKATSAMARALTMYTQSFGDVTREGITPQGEIGDVSEFGGFSFTNKEGGPLKFLVERFQDLGLDTRTIASENADYDNPAAPFLNKLAYVSSFIFNHSERAIRQVTAASSYILEVEKAYAEANKGKPTKKIKDMSETEIEQFGPEAAKTAIEFMEYANSSALLATAPRWAQTGAGAVIYQFKRFPAQVLYIQMRMLKAMSRQARGVARTPEQIEEDRALRSAFIYTNLVGGALVGAKGIPFYGVAAAVANLFLDEDEDDANTIVAKTIGDGWYYGMLAEKFGIDVTDRIALTNLLVRDPGNYRNEDFLSSALETYGGPTIGIATRVGENGYRLFDDDPKNNERAIEGILPTSFSNIKKATRNFGAGAYETTRGDPIISDVTVGDAIKEAIGFRPAELRAAQDRLARDRRVVNGIVDMRSALLDRYAFAHSNEDEAGKEEVKKDIKAFNEKHRVVAIDDDSLQQSLETRARGSKIAEILGGNVTNERFINMLLESRAEYQDFN